MKKKSEKKRGIDILLKMPYISGDVIALDLQFFIFH
jgi:hypothetical protein